MPKPILDLLEVHLTSKCNLRCIGCTSFSDYQFDDAPDWPNNKKNLKIWATRVDVKAVALAGGEPTMLPEISNIIQDLRLIFPAAMINLVTNGTYLLKKPEIVTTLHDIGHASLTISNHEPEKSYFSKIQKFVLDLYDWRPCAFRSDWMETDNHFYVEFRPASLFINPIHGTYGSARPHFSDATTAFENCCFGNTFNFFQGNLYKCSPLQYLKRMLTDWKQLEDPDWQFYLGYRPLQPQCSDHELANFFSNLNRAEPYCSMCPSADMPNGQYKKRGQLQITVDNPGKNL